MAVDHFRPKNKVEGCRDHPGYHWLAFDWRNFRYACTYCNSRRTTTTSTPGGKQCHFPLLNEGTRARSETDRWEHEEVEILDPYVRTDVKLLTFIETGEPWPADADEESTDYRRANTSIRVYHLDEDAVNRKRKRIRIQIRNWVVEIDKDPDSHELLKREILRRIRESAEYSTAARIYLRAYRSKPWVLELLEQV